MPVAPTIPSPTELEEFVNHLAHAISVIDELGGHFRSLRGELHEVEPQHITVEELSTLFIFVSEAKEACEDLIRYADELIDGLPELPDRDGGYAAMFAGVQ
jgi:hypothetical protein